MTFKPRTWFPIATILSVVNVVAAGFAAVPAEPWHAGTHALLAAAFAAWAVRLHARLGAARPETRQEALEAPSGLESLEDEMHFMRQELAETQERLEFAERMLAQGAEVRREPREPS